jgi:hypothetical protein
MIGLVLFEQTLYHLGITVKTVGLVERPLVIIQTQPFHAIEDCPHGFRRGALQVGIFDTQDKDAFVGARL